MTDDLDKLEQIARRAQESFGDSVPDWYNGGWAEESVPPDVVLRLIARLRHYEQTIARIAQEAPWVVTGK